MRIQKELMRIMARGRDSCQQTYFGGKLTKYAKGSTPENKISKKHNFLDINTPKYTSKQTP